MTGPVEVEIIGAPVACAEGVKETWRELAQWIGDQLHRRYGSAVKLVYYDLFDAQCPPLPPGAQLPLVLVKGEVLTSGGKLSMPAIRRRLELLAAKEEPGQTGLYERIMVTVSNHRSAR